MTFRRKRRYEVEFIHGNNLKPGDRVLIECEVYDNPDDWPAGSHRHVRPVKRNFWNVGDQHLWTWSGKYSAGINTQPKIMRVINH